MGMPHCRQEAVEAKGSYTKYWNAQRGGIICALERIFITLWVRLAEFAMVAGTRLTAISFKPPISPLYFHKNTPHIFI
jgi:hypothetical protein